MNNRKSVDYIRLAVNNGPLDDPKKEASKKVHWWQSVHPMQALQIPIGMVTTYNMTCAIAFMVDENWYAASQEWMFAFFSLSLFCAFGYGARKNIERSMTKNSGQE